MMTLAEAKTSIDSTGQAFLTLWNSAAEWVFIGQVDKMTTKDGRVKFSWKLPVAEHVSAFTHAGISGAKIIYTNEEIVPIRLDVGTKKYEVIWDV